MTSNTVDIRPVYQQITPRVGIDNIPRPVANSTFPAVAMKYDSNTPTETPKIADRNFEMTLSSEVELGVVNFGRNLNWCS